MYIVSQYPVYWKNKVTVGLLCYQPHYMKFEDPWFPIGRPTWLRISYFDLLITNI